MLVVFLSIVMSSAGFAQQQEPFDTRAGIVFGLSQIALGGFNVEGNFFYKRLTFDYSHGVSLNFSNAQLEAGADQNQALDIHIPWTTGLGVGYRFTPWLNLRVEPKWHKYELYYAGAAQEAVNLIEDYTTFTLGVGLYANLMPFKHQNNFLKGITIAPNARWWPRISSSLPNNEFRYDNQITEQPETHIARQIGMGNTPFFVNMSIGYVIQF